MTNEAKQQWIVWWVLWAAFQVGILVMYQFLSGGPVSPKQAAAEPQIWLVGFAPLLVSVIIRWAVLPKATNAVTALPMFIVGIAMAEATLFIGLFIFPSHRQEMFVMSAVGIFQFIPFFARRFFDDGDPDSLKGRTE